MKKVKLYDLRSGYKDEMSEARDKFWVVEGKKGVVVSYNQEGVHNVYDSLDDEISFFLYDKPKGKRIPMTPKAKVHLTIRELIEKFEFTEWDVKDMVRVFGARLDNNYVLLLRSMREIGIHLDEYNTDRR